MEPWVVPLAALVVSIVTLLFTAIALHGKSTVDYTQSIEHRLARTEEDLRDCARERARLERTVLHLTHEVLMLKAGQDRRS